MDKRKFKEEARKLLSLDTSHHARLKVSKWLLGYIEYNYPDAYRYVAWMPDFKELNSARKFEILNNGIDMGLIDCEFEKAWLSLDRHIINYDEYVETCKPLAERGQLDAIAVVAENEYCDGEPEVYLKMLCDSWQAEHESDLSLGELVTTYCTNGTKETRQIINTYAPIQLRRILNTLLSIDKYSIESNDYLMALVTDYDIPYEYKMKVIDYLMNKRQYFKAYDWYAIRVDSADDLDKDFLLKGIAAGSKECDAIMEYRIGGKDYPETCIPQLQQLDNKHSLYAAEYLFYIYMDVKNFDAERAFAYGKKLLSYGSVYHENFIQQDMFNYLYLEHHYQKVMDEKDELFTEPQIKEYEEVIEISRND